METPVREFDRLQACLTLPTPARVTLQARLAREASLCASRLVWG